MTKVKIKTGTVDYASTDATPYLKICDGLATCCETLGLDNYGNDRPSGQVDVYQAGWQLGNCTKVDHKWMMMYGNFRTQMDIFGKINFWYIKAIFPFGYFLACHLMSGAS